MKDTLIYCAQGIFYFNPKNGIVTSHNLSDDFGPKPIKVDMGFIIQMATDANLDSTVAAHTLLKTQYHIDDIGYWHNEGYIPSKREVMLKEQLALITNSSSLARDYIKKWTSPVESEKLFFTTVLDKVIMYCKLFLCLCGYHQWVWHYQEDEVLDRSIPDRAKCDRCNQFYKEEQV